MRSHEATLLLTLIAAGGAAPRGELNRRRILIDTCVTHGWLFVRHDADDTIAITKLGRTAVQRYRPDGYAAAAAEACAPAAATTRAAAETIIREAAHSNQIRTFALCNRGGRA